MRIGKLLCRAVCVGLGGIWLFACKPGVPSGVIPPDDLEEILYDYHLAQAMAENGARDSMDFRRYSYVRAVFDKHGVTEAEFDTAMVWYSSHATYLHEIYQRLRERYSGGVATLGAATGTGDVFANLDAQGDTANIWQGHTFVVLKPVFAENRMTFSLKADTTFQVGDVLLWRFDSRQIAHGRASETYAGFYVQYDNDSTAGVVRRVYSSNRVQLRLEGDTVHAIREIGGFVYCKPADDKEEPRFQILQDFMLIRIHQQLDSVQADTAKVVPAVADSLSTDSAQDVTPASNRRLSPTELRDSRPVERSINVVKEKPYRVIRGQTRGARTSRDRR